MGALWSFTAMKSEGAAATRVENRRPLRGEGFLVGGRKLFRLCRRHEVMIGSSLCQVHSAAGWLER